MSDVVFNILANIQSAVDDIKKLQQESVKSFNGINNSSKKAQGGLDLIKKAAVAAGAAFAAIGIKNFVVDAVASLGEFSKAVAEVRSIAPEAIKNNKNLEQSFIDLGNQFGSKAADQAALLYQIISAGVTDAVKSQEALIAANKLAIGGLSTTGESVNILTTALNVYKDENLTAANAADILFTTVRLGKTTISELSGSLGNVLPIAKSFGVSFEEVSATIADLTAKGIPTTAQAVTGLRGIFSGVIQAQSQLAKESPAIQKAFSINALKTKEFSVFLRDANEAVGGSQIKLKQLLGSIEGVTSFVTLAGDNFEGLASSVDQVTNSAGAADKAFNEISNTVGFQSEKLRANLGNLVLKFASQNEGVVLGILETVNSGITLIIDNANDIAEIFGRLTRLATSFFLSFKLAGPALAGARVAIASLSQPMFGLVATGQTVFTKIKLAGVLAFNAIKISVNLLKASMTLGLTFAIDAVIGLIFDLKEEFGGFVNLGIVGFQKIKQVALEFVNALLGGFGRLASFAGIDLGFAEAIESNNAAIAESGALIDDIKNQVKKNNGEIVKSYEDSSKKIVDDQKDAAQSQIDAAKDAAAAKIQADKDAAEQAAQANLTVVEQLKKQYENAGLSQIEIANKTAAANLLVVQKALADRLISEKEAAQLSFKIEADATKKILDEKARLQKEADDEEAERQRKKDETAIIKKGTIATVTDSLGAGVGSALGSLADNVINPIGAFTGGVEAAVGVLQGIVDFFPKIINSISGLFNSITDLPIILQQAIEGLFDAIVNFITNFLTNYLKSIGGLIKSAFTFLFKRLPQAFIDLFRSLGPLIKEILKDLPDILISLFDNFPDLITTVITSFIDAIPDVVFALVDTLVLKGGIFRIAFAFAKAMVLLVPAIARGFVQSFAKLLEGVFPNLGKLFSSGIKFPEIKLPTVKIDLGPVEDFFSRIADSFEDITGIFEEVAKALDAAGNAGGFVGQVFRNPGEAFGNLGKGGFKFAQGGLIPDGFPNDTFPASLTSGEFVIDRSDTKRLSRFLDSQEGQDSSSQNIVIQLQVGEKNLADVIYSLNRKGFRTA